MSIVWGKCVRKKKKWLQALIIANSPCFGTFVGNQSGQVAHVAVIAIFVAAMRSGCLVRKIAAKM